MGYREECDAIRRGWRENGSSAAYAAVADELIDSLGVYGTVEECRERLAQQDEAGITLHGVSIHGDVTDAEQARIYEALMR